MPMSGRLLLVLAVFLGLLTGPVVRVPACVAQPNKPVCRGCCPKSLEACCALSPASPQKTPPAQTAPTAPELKQAPLPAFVFLYRSPQLAAERPSVHKQQAARMPVPPLLDLHCIRLI
jgi:hypothetical protein